MSIFNFLLLTVSSTEFSVTLLILWVILIVLLLSSAMVSGSEVAFFSLSPALFKDLEEDQSKASQSILKLVAHPRELLATILIFNNFINVAIVLVSSYISMHIFNPEAVTVFGVLISGDTLVFMVNVVLITFILLMIGEVIPKVYAAKFPVKLLRVTVPILDVVNSFFIMVRITPTLVKSTKIFNAKSTVNHNVTMDDLQHALELTSEASVETEDKKIMEGVVKFGNTDVKQIMTPRVKSILMDINTPFLEVVKIIKETHFSRIPIYEESIDVVKGVLYAKDLLPYLDKKVLDWKGLIREPFFVPENKKIDNLLTEFQSKKTHIAIVVDEYGGVSGLVTLEDVIEEIVGDISDEFDDEELYFSKLSDSCFVFEGQTSLINMYRALDVEGEDFEDRKGEADSVAGFVLEIAGRIPQKGETIQFRNCVFTIESADRRRLKSVKVDVDRNWKDD